MRGLSGSIAPEKGGLLLPLMFLVTLSFTAGLLLVLPAVPSVRAQTVISITTSNGSTVCPASPLSGTWSGDTCTVSATVTIPSGTTLVIGAGVTVANPPEGVAAGSDYSINNAGTLDNFGSISVGGYCLFNCVHNSGTINNVGTMEADQGWGNSVGFSNSGGTVNNFGSLIVDSTALGITNSGTINNVGTMEGTATTNGIVNGIGETINNAGSMTGISIADEGGISNGGTINDYCGATLSGGTATNTYTCSTVTFDQSGIPTSGVTWGVTVSWGPFPSFDYTGTGASIPLQATGSLTYSYDTPITSSGTEYGCISGCSGSATISGDTTFTAGYVVVVASSTSVSCSPSSVSVGSPSTCTSGVTGDDPTGTVTFSTSVGSTSQFSSTTCSLSSGSCSVTYTPSSGASPVTITASYGGDFGNFPSSGTFSLTVNTATTTTSVSCSSTAGAGSPSTCTAEVTGDDPTGTVTFSTSVGDASQFSSTACSLSSGSCYVTFTPSSSTSPVTITASYGGDSNNAPSSGTFSLIIGIVITTSNGSTVCPGSLGGTWSSTTETCSLTFQFTIPTGTNLDIGTGVTITVTDSSTAIGSQIAVINSGTINNYGTLSGSSTHYLGVDNPGGTINNYGTLSGSSNTYYPGISNSGTINNAGSMSGSSIGSNGISNTGTINNDGSMSGSGGTGIESTGGTINNDGSMSGSGTSFGIINVATINDYCGVTLSYSSYYGNTPNTISCYTVTFDQSGIPASVTWGVTVSWSPASGVTFLSVDHTGTGASIPVQATGSLNYSYYTPITSSGTNYDCISGCSGTATISGATTFTAIYPGTSVSCSPSSVTVGSPTTCTAQVTGNSPTGTVTFSTSVGSASQFSSTTCSLSSGSCQVTYTPSSSTSPVTITASYGGDSNNAPSSGTFSLTVTTSYSVTFGQTGIPSGVNWGVTVGGTDYLCSTYCTDSSGSSITVSGLAGTVTYSYDSPVASTGVSYICASDCTGSVSSSADSPNASYNVQYIPSLSTTLSSSTITVGQPVSDSATLTGASSSAGGSVTYYYYSGGSCGGTGTQVGPAVTVMGGVVPPSSPQLFASTGAFSWNAVYSGDSNDLPATSACESLTVNPASPAISTTLSSSSTTVGTSTTDVSTFSGGFNPTGSVTFTVYSDSGCTQAVLGYSSSVSVSGNGQYTSGPFTSTSPGTYYWTASYGGDSNNNPAGSACAATGEVLTVTKASPAVSTSASPATVAFGVSSSDAATISGGYDPTGTITYSVFSDNACQSPVTSYAASSVTISGDGIAPASAPFTAPAVGTYYWQAVYSGDSNNNGLTRPCASSGETLTVTARATTVTISCPTTAVNGQAACTVTVTDKDTGPAVTPTGVVDTFSDGGAGGAFNATSCTLASGKCGIGYAPSSGSAGVSIAISVKYEGDSTHLQSTGSTSLTPTKRTTTLSIACPTTPEGVPTTCTATVTDTNVGTTITPTGTVGTFSDNGAGGTFGSTSCTLSAGSCTFTYTPPTSAAGTTITISATYGGDSAHITSTGSASLSVMTPEQAIQSLINTVNGMNLQQGVTQSVDAQLNSALNSLNRGDARGAISQLDGLISQLGHGHQQIPASDAQLIVSSAQSIVNALMSPTTTTVSCSPSSAQAGSSVRCTATVTGDQAGGNVTFASTSTTGSFDPFGPGRQRNSCQLGGNFGQGGGQQQKAQACTIQYSDPSAGTPTITASYSGDFANLPSSGATAVTFTQVQTTTSVFCQPREMLVGQTTQCTAFVGRGNGGQIGTVSWISNSTAVSFVPSSATCTLTEGDQHNDQGQDGQGVSCSIQFTSSAGGTMKITATYSGDPNNLPSSGSSNVFVRPPQRSTTSLTCEPDEAKAGSAITCTVTVSGTDPTGTVTFSTSSSTGTFSSSTCTLAPGPGPKSAHCQVTYTDTSTAKVTITGSYSGDPNNLASSDSATVKFE